MFFWVLDRGKRKPLTSELDWNWTVSQTFLHEFRGKLRTKNHPSLQLLNLAASRNWRSMALSWARRPPHWRSGRCWRRKSGCWPAVVGRKQNRNRARRRRRCRGSKDQQGALGRDGCRMVETSNQWRHWICSTNAKCCMVGGWCLCAVDGDTGDTACKHRILSVFVSWLCFRSLSRCSRHVGTKHSYQKSRCPYWTILCLQQTMLPRSQRNSFVSQSNTVQLQEHQIISVVSFHLPVSWSFADGSSLRGQPGTRDFWLGWPYVTWFVWWGERGGLLCLCERW